MNALRQVPGPAGSLTIHVQGEGGLPVVFVHGNTGDHTHWGAQQAHLRTLSVALDLRGMGRSSSDPHGRYGFEAAVEDVAAVVDALALRRFVLVGHSFGGAVVGAYAARHPERLAGLLYVDAGGDLRSLPREATDAFLAQFSPEAYPAFREHWFDAPLQHARPGTRERVLATLHATPREVARDNMMSLLRFDPGEAFARYHGPTHAVVAEAFAGPESLVGQRPDLPRTVLPDVSHWLMMDAPEAFNAALDAFLRSCDAAGGAPLR
jgi:pimeloyl-ACP methyl ester carboxylesterase